MPNVDIPKPYQDGEDLSEANLDTCFEYIETLLNTTKLDSTNIQAGGIETSNLAASAVTTAKIDASAVTTVKIIDDAITTAKILDANVTQAKLAADITAQFVPTGLIAPYGASAAPSGWLNCDGSLVSRTTYAALFAIIGAAHGSGDGSTTFALPDYRGRFLRGTTTDTARDPDYASRTAMATGGNTGSGIGSIQSDQVAAHTHTVPIGVGSGNAGIGGADGDYSTPQTSSSFGGNETRPKNANVNWIIKT